MGGLPTGKTMRERRIFDGIGWSVGRYVRSLANGEGRIESIGGRKNDGTTDDGAIKLKEERRLNGYSNIKLLELCVCA